jgi:hypothetical protein
MFGTVTDVLIMKDPVTQVSSHACPSNWVIETLSCCMGLL